MDDGPQGGGEDRTRRGPLGDDAGDDRETRRVRRASEAGEEEETRRVPQEETERQRGGTPRGAFSEGDPETRVIRTPGAQDEDTPRGYLEAVDQREERLRDIYGGVDWLASFIGCVIAIVSAAVLLGLSGLVLRPLGFTLDLAGRQIGAAIITGLVILGLALLLAYFFGGYVAGRLARFDGGRNGMMSVAWSLTLVLLMAAIGSFLPGRAFDVLQQFVRGTVLPAVDSLVALGLAGAGIIIGALLMALLGGFLGGRLGGRYHSRIDHTT